MAFALSIKNTYQPKRLAVKLNSKGEQFVLQGHPWVFSNNINKINEDANSLLSVVNETIATGTDPNGINSENQDVYYCSEKSIRPFLNLQIPIFNSTIGYSEWFEKTYGFDLFTDIIDYRKWDKIFKARKINL